jgi:hypothetical protein
MQAIPVDFILGGADHAKAAFPGPRLESTLRGAVRDEQKSRIEARDAPQFSRAHGMHRCPKRPRCRSLRRTHGIETLETLRFTSPPFGFPSDAASWVALLLAPALFLAARLLLRVTSRRPRFLPLAALAALVLSAAYVSVHLRGGPRIIDATSYFLEARALAEGYLAWPLDAPATSTLGRFLVRAEHAGGPTLAVIFPPGYPALLALGFLLRAPMAVGPLLAAALVIATFALARLLAQSPALSAEARALSLPRLAALLSVTCAALRYHTADTMSHGLAALCLTLALLFTFLALDASSSLAAPRRHAWAALAGLAAGWLAATRPVSALALSPVLALAFLVLGRALPSRARLTLGAALVAGLLPGLALLLAHQHAATGALGLSSQRLYYALADGPPDCFRYGFGEGIGCLGEHGDFVRHNLPRGFGAFEAAATTLRRLKLHLVDAANAEPLALLVPLGVILGAREPRVRLLALMILAQIVAYAPFYFDGNYPGGGARFFADLLPIEHVLLALAMAGLAARWPGAAGSTGSSLAARLGPERWGAALLALSLLGFAFRAGFDHALLRDREGGRPMFEPERLREAGVDRGLVFLDSDHGFNLAFDPRAALTHAAAKGGLEARRFHGDDLDRLAWEHAGRPPAFRYRFEPAPEGGRARVLVEPLSFPQEAPKTLQIEGESLHPPVAQRAGWALPEHASGTCASSGRWLSLHTAPAAAPARVTVELPPAAWRGRALAPRAALGPGAKGALLIFVDGAERWRWQLDAAIDPTLPAALRCLDLAPFSLPGGASRVELALEARSSREASSAEEPIFALDRVDFTPAKAVDP